MPSRTYLRRWTPLAGLLMAVGLVALTVAPAEAADHHVTIEQYSYGPGNLSVDQGDTVTWTNHDSVEHDVVVTSGPESFRSPLLGQGESWSHTFATAGSYSYICSLHPDMRAAVTAAAAPEPPTTSAPALTQTQRAVPSAPATTSEQPAAPGAKRKRSPTASGAAPSATPAVRSTPAATQPDAASASLNPLLLVAGAAIAVVVFCLLLMASRPIQPQASTPDEES